MKSVQRPVVALTALLIAGCSGGGGSPLTSPAAPSGGSNSGSATPQSVHVTLNVPAVATTGKAAIARARALGNRKRDFVGGNTRFVTVSTYTANPKPNTTASNNPSTQNFYGAQTTDISPPSENDPNSTCKNNTPPATGYSCSFNVTAPAGTDYFEFQTYASDPSASPKPAVIGQAFSAATTISNNASNSISATIGGVIASFSYIPVSPVAGSSPTTYVPGPHSFDSSQAATLYYEVNALDASRETIIASSSTNDPYVNPIETSLRNFSTGNFDGNTAALQGNLVITLNGTTAPADTTPMMYSSDVLTVGYTPSASNPGAPGAAAEAVMDGQTDGTYFTPVNSESGGAISPIQFSVTATNPGSVSSATPTIVYGGNGTYNALAFSLAGQTATVTPVEAPASSYTAALSGCGSDTTITPATGTAFTITAGKIADTATCVATFTDASGGGQAVEDITSSVGTSTLHVVPNIVFGSTQFAPGSGTGYSTQNGFQAYEVDTPFNFPTYSSVGFLGSVSNISSTVGGIAYGGAISVNGQPATGLYQGVGASINSYGFVIGAGITPTGTLTLPTPSGGKTPIVAGLDIDPTSKFLAAVDAANNEGCGYTTPTTPNQAAYTCFPLPGAPSGVSVDRNDNFYIVLQTSPNGPEVFVLNPFQPGVPSTSFTLGNAGTPVGIGVDAQAAPSIFVTQGTKVYRYDSNTSLNFKGSSAPVAQGSVDLSGSCTSLGGISVLTGGNDQDTIAVACPGGNPGIRTLYYNGPAAGNGAGLNFLDITSANSKTVAGSTTTWVAF